MNLRFRNRPQPLPLSRLGFLLRCGQVLFDDCGHGVLGVGLHFHQQWVLRLRQIKALAQVGLDALQQRGGHFRISQCAMCTPCAGQLVQCCHRT